MADNLKSLIELNPMVNRESEVIWDINLPPKINRDRIGLNVDHAQIHIKNFDLDYLHFSEFWASEPLYGQQTVSLAEVPGPDDTRQTIGYIVLNRFMLGSKIADKINRDGYSDEDAWISEMNRFIKTGLFAMNQSIHRFQYVDKSHNISDTLRYLKGSCLISLFGELLHPIKADPKQ